MSDLDFSKLTDEEIDQYNELYKVVVASCSDVFPDRYPLTALLFSMCKRIEKLEEKNLLLRKQLNELDNRTSGLLRC